MTTTRRNKLFTFRILALLICVAIVVIVAIVWAIPNDTSLHAKLERAKLNWAEGLRHYKQESVEEELDIVTRWSLATDPFQWSTISGKQDKWEGMDETWLPIHLDTYRTCGIFSFQEHFPHFFGKDWMMVDGRDELWEWDWTDSSTDKHQIIELRFRLKPRDWRTRFLDLFGHTDDGNYRNLRFREYNPVVTNSRRLTTRCTGAAWRWRMVPLSCWLIKPF